MEKLPVRLLTELITLEDRITARGVWNTIHVVQYCPVCVCLPEESDIYWNHQSGGERSEVLRYTPRAYYAIKVFEKARDGLLSQQEFAGLLDIEWYPVAASFNSIRYVRGYPERFIRRLFEDMEQIADSGMIDIQYGRFDAQDSRGGSDVLQRCYIIPSDTHKYKEDSELEKAAKSVQGKPVERMSWKDIKDAFVVLKPIQLAFIAGNLMNRHSSLDDEFVDACGSFDYDRVRALVEQGANIHAATQYGDTAMSEMVENYYEWEIIKTDRENYYCPIIDDRNYDSFVKISKFLLSLGYDLNLAGYEGASPLSITRYYGKIEVARFLLDNGADPNLPSDIGLGNVYGENILILVSEEGCYPYSRSDELAELLRQYGAREECGKYWLQTETRI